MCYRWGGGGSMPGMVTKLEKSIHHCKWQLLPILFALAFFIEEMGLKIYFFLNTCT